MRPSASSFARPIPQRGFTLVEVLVVILIIAVLIAVLVPVTAAVGRQAKIAATKASLQTLSTALETFRADGQVGGLYPPSASDMMSGNKLTYQVADPRGGGGLASKLIEISGGGLLVWALAGADLLGTPGFKTFKSGSQYWAQDTTATVNASDRSQSGAYAVDATTFQPIHARVGPLVDLAKVKVTQYNQGLETAAGRGGYEIPAETSAFESIGRKPPKREYPFFLDAFDQPILYWRADPAGLSSLDRSPSDQGATGTNRGVYHYLDNGAMFGPATGGGPGTRQSPLVLRADQNTTDPHPALRYDTSVSLNDPTAAQKGFAGYIRNTAITAQVRPFNPDTFLLVSPGPDGVYGTEDDIANFEHNGGSGIAGYP